ncbi:MAG: hypothetical protein IPF55_10420 [Rhodoferax sp.]|nr:hypothetical protein [Rhodoferax sp.]
MAITLVLLALSGPRRLGLQHHPVGAASAVKAPKAAMERMAKMDEKMKTMRELRDKMMAAKSAEERGTVMAQAMTAMQADMPMMGGMGMGMGAKEGMGSKA